MGALMFTCPVDDFHFVFFRVIDEILTVGGLTRGKGGVCVSREFDAWSSPPAVTFISNKSQAVA